MQSNFRLKLTLTMIIFALVISITIATLDHLRLKDEVLNHHQFQIIQIEEHASYAIQTIEKAYFLFGEELSSNMKESSRYLLDLYQRQPNLEQWDFQRLSQLLGFDIYMINEHNVITHSSFVQDVGLDFDECCQKLASELNARRDSGEFFADGLDIEQQTGLIKKYSYMATEDKAYLVQLGYALENGDIFQHFNFLTTLEELTQEFSSVNDINILNLGGYALGKPVVAEHKLPPERRQAFEQALASGQTTEVRDGYGSETAIFRYVPYVSNFDQGATKQKVLEVVYNEHELNQTLRTNREMFLLRLLIVLAVTVLMALIISRWVARPMYLAFHDSLTGLKNRAAFNEMLGKHLEEVKETMALLMIDLDNFKQVNDQLGHDAGDRLLKQVAQAMLMNARKGDMAFRLGGDEFVMLMPDADRQIAEATAEHIIASVRSIALQPLELLGEQVTMSIGIALVPDHGTDPDMLCKRADVALYASKHKGKNQYSFYNHFNE